MENIQWKDPLIAKNEKFLMHYGIKGMKWGKHKTKSDSNNPNDPNLKYYYGKDGKVYVWYDKKDPNAKYTEQHYLDRKPSDMADYGSTYYDEEGNRRTYYMDVDKNGKPKGDVNSIKEHVTPEETVRREKLYSDVAKAKNPIDMGKAFVDFALASVNKFLKSIFK